MKIRLYSPLKGRVWLSPDYRDDEFEDECEELDGGELVDYQENIEEEMKGYNKGEMTAKGLMKYYSDLNSNEEIEKAVSEKSCQRGSNGKKY